MSYSKLWFIAMSFLFLTSQPVRSEVARQVIIETVVQAPRDVVWRHWTTLDGLRTLFISPQPPLQGDVQLRANGPYELYFLADAQFDMRGTEGSRILAYDEGRMLSFTWRNTPQWPAVRPYYTHVIVTLEDAEPGATRVRLVQSGFASGSDWDATYAYFAEAWARVLGRLQARYAS